MIWSSVNFLSLLTEGERVRELSLEEEGEMMRLLVLIGTPSRGKWSW